MPAGRKLKCIRCGHQWSPRTARPVQCPRCHSPLWARERIRLRAAPEGGRWNDAAYGISHVAGVLNRLVREKAIRGWVVYGSVAYSLWAVPLTTADLDVFIPAADDADYARQLRAIASAGHGHASGGFAVRIGDVRVEVFPASMHPMYVEAVRTAARRRTGGGEPVRVVRPEYLTVMALVAWRHDYTRGVDDEQRARSLLRVCDAAQVNALVDKYGGTFPRVSEREIRDRLARVLG